MKSAIVLLAALSAVVADVSHLKHHNGLQGRLRIANVKQDQNVGLDNSFVNGIPPPVPHHQGGPQIAILKQDQDVGFDGNYHYSYETENGIKVDEQGSVKQLGEEELAQQAQGSVSYVSPEGENVQLSYIADENGFQPQGSHLPVAPPIPDAILRALEYIRTHPSSEPVN